MMLPLIAFRTALVLSLVVRQGASINDVAADGPVAIVPIQDISGLQAKLQTTWRLISADSASQADLQQALALIPDWAFLRDQSTLSSLLAKMTSARLLQLSMTGYDRLNLSSIPGQYTVCNIRNMGTAIPEYILAAILSWSVRLPQLDADFRKCTWHEGPASCKPPSPHREAKGQTVGILGYGTIGSGLAQRAAALGMRAIAVTEPVPESLPPHLAWIGNDTMLPRLMQESDFVVVSLPLLPSTQGLVDASLIASMKPQGVLINVARGPIVDEAALYKALVSKQIGGAVLDVWWQEGGGWPSKFNFSAVPNVWMTPHTSYDTAEAQEEGKRQMASNLDAIVLGQPFQNVVRGPIEVGSTNKLSTHSRSSVGMAASIANTIGAAEASISV